MIASFCALNLRIRFLYAVLERWNVLSHVHSLTSCFCGYTASLINYIHFLWSQESFLHSGRVWKSFSKHHKTKLDSLSLCCRPKSHRFKTAKCQNCTPTCCKQKGSQRTLTGSIIKCCFRFSKPFHLLKSHSFSSKFVVKSPLEILPHLVTLSTYRRYTNNCIYLSIYLYDAWLNHKALRRF